jgi:hypothetical protein
VLPWCVRLSVSLHLPERERSGRTSSSVGISSCGGELALDGGGIVESVRRGMMVARERRGEYEKWRNLQFCLTARDKSDYMRAKLFDAKYTYDIR